MYVCNVCDGALTSRGVSAEVRRQSQTSVLVFHLFEIRSSCCFVLSFGLVFHCTRQGPQVCRDPPVSALPSPGRSTEITAIPALWTDFMWALGVQTQVLTLASELAWLCAL